MGVWVSRLFSRASISGQEPTNRGGFSTFCQNTAKFAIEFADYSDGVDWDDFAEAMRHMR
jgi:hypothetical protein